MLGSLPRQNRHCACGETGTEGRYTTFEGDWRQAIAFVKSANVARRHLSPGERAMVAAAIANVAHGGNRRSAQEAPGGGPEIITRDRRLASAQARGIVALTGAGLKLDRPLAWRTWGLTWRLLDIAMPLSILGITLVGHWLLGLTAATRYCSVRP